MADMFGLDTYAGHRGLMVKRGWSRSNWKERFFVLEGTRLAYYASKSAADGGKKPKGEFRLSHDSVITAVEGGKETLCPMSYEAATKRKRGKEPSIKILEKKAFIVKFWKCRTGPGLKDVRTYYCSCASEGERRAWIFAARSNLEHAIHHEPAEFEDLPPITPAVLIARNQNPEHVPDKVSGEYVIQKHNNGVNWNRFAGRANKPSSVGYEERVEQASKLHTLDLSGFGIDDLPLEIAELVGLKCLSLDRNDLTSFPVSLTVFTRLERLYMSENENLGADAVVMGRLPPTLRYVALEGCHLQVVPHQAMELPDLHKLFLGQNRLTQLPDAITGLGRLQFLSLADNQIGSMPAGLAAGCTALATLVLDNNFLPSLGEPLVSLPSLTSLSVAGNQIHFVADEIAGATNLKRLNLSSNGLSTFPVALLALHGLEQLFLSSNNIGELPETICSMIDLDWLSIDDNSLTALPATLTELSRMRNLAIARNPLPVSFLMAEVTGGWDAVAALLKGEAPEAARTRVSSMPAEAHRERARMRRNTQTMASRRRHRSLGAKREKRRAATLTFARKGKRKHKGGGGGRTFSTSSRSRSRTGTDRMDRAAAAAAAAAAGRRGRSLGGSHGSSSYSYGNEDPTSFGSSISFSASQSGSRTSSSSSSGAMDAAAWAEVADDGGGGGGGGGGVGRNGTAVAGADRVVQPPRRKSQ